MQKNQNDVDRFIRIIVGGLFLLSTSYLPIQPWVAMVFLIVGLILMVTGMTGFCPIYNWLKLNTKK